MKKPTSPFVESWMEVPQLALQPLTEDMIQQEKNQFNPVLCFAPQPTKQRVKATKTAKKPYLH